MDYETREIVEMLMDRHEKARDGLIESARYARAESLKQQEIAKVWVNLYQAVVQEYKKLLLESLSEEESNKLLEKMIKRVNRHE